jgi:hypothetical protein
MMRINGVSPLEVLDAYIAAAVVLMFLGAFAALQQQPYSPIGKHGLHPTQTQTKRRPRTP